MSGLTREQLLAGIPSFVADRKPHHIVVMIKRLEGAGVPRQIAPTSKGCR